MDVTAFFATCLVLMNFGTDGFITDTAKPRHQPCSQCTSGSLTCRALSGLYTQPDHPPGYNLIAQIPAGACNFTASQKHNVHNYIALRAANGSFIINGGRVLTPPGQYKIPGCTLTYKRSARRETEQITCDGQLMEPVDLMLFIQGINRGLEYAFSIPQAEHTDSRITLPTYINDAGVSNEKHSHPHRHHHRLQTESQSEGEDISKSRFKTRRPKFRWLLLRYHPCTKSCGSGVEEPHYVCVKGHPETIAQDRKCARWPKPEATPRPCNTQPCAAEWVIGNWSTCSKSCGDGTQQREVFCKQEITSNFLLTVQDASCEFPKPPSIQKCFRQSCEERTVPPSTLPSQLSTKSSHGISKWEVGEWSQCSVTCGDGLKSRLVFCPVENCSTEDKPVEIVTCNMRSCQGMWVVTEWPNECSTDCGEGTQQRKVSCLGSFCNPESRPDTERSCSRDKHCSGKWFTGPWDKCHGTCNRGEQKRSVLCIMYNVANRTETVLPPHRCDQADKPENSRTCGLPPCDPSWYTGEWSECTKSCEGGSKEREVVCLDKDGQPSDHCLDHDRPRRTMACNIFSCDSKGPTDKSCTDTHPQCHTIVQARFCRYEYYYHLCCYSCELKKAKDGE